MGRSVHGVRRVVLAALVAPPLVGCQGTLDLVLPSAPEGSRSLIFALGLTEAPQDASHELFATDVGGVLELPMRVEDGESVHVLYHRRTLEELGLSRGSFFASATFSDGRHLAPADAAYEATVDGRTAAGWHLVAPDAQPVIVVPEVGPLDCLKRGGCVAEEPGLCLPSCEPRAPDAPASPEPINPVKPVAWACPTGWSSDLIPGLPEALGCAPPIPAECPFGQIQVPGDSGCRRLGGVCPGAEFRDSLPSGVPSGAPRIHVRPGAIAGDGSIEAPFGTLAEAIAAAPPGSVVLLGAGVFAGDVVVRNELFIIGGCPSVTRILGHLSFGNVAVLDGIEAAGALTVEAGGDLTLRDAIVEGGPACISVRGPGRLSASEVDFRECEIGLELDDGTIADLQRVVFSATSRVNVFAVGSSVTITDGAFTLRPGVTGVDLQGGDLTLRRSVLQGAPDATTVNLERTRASLADVVFRDGTRALSVSDGEITVSGASFRAVPASGLAFVRSSAELADVIVDGAGTGALLWASGGSLSMVRAYLAVAGANALMFGARAHLEDVSVRVRCPTGSCVGAGILVQTAPLDAERLEIDSEGGGIAFYGPLSTSTLRDVEIQLRGSGAAEPLAGRDADLHVTRARLIGPANAPVVDVMGGEQVFEDLRASGGEVTLYFYDTRRVELSRSIVADGGFRCLANAVGSELRVSDTVFERCGTYGLLSLGGITTLERVAVLESDGVAIELQASPFRQPTSKALMASDLLIGPGLAEGLVLATERDVSIERFAIEGRGGVGLSFQGGFPTLIDGLVQQNAIGLDPIGAELLPDHVARVWAPRNRVTVP